MKISALDYYLIFLAITGAVIYLFLYTRYNTAESNRYSDKAELVIRPPRGLFVITLLVCWFGFIFSNFAPFFPFWASAAVITVLVLFFNYLATDNLFFWVHFFDKKIVVSYPIQARSYEIMLDKITAAGYQENGRGSHYFIQFELNGIQKLIKINHALSSEWPFRTYFTSKNINYVKLN